MKYELKPAFISFACVALGLFFLASCGPQDDTVAHDPIVSLGGLDPYVSEFQQEGTTLGSPIQITDLIIRFGAMSNPLERGYCEIATNQTPTIILDQDFWNQSSEGARKSLLLHELGHCVLERIHLSALTNTGVPASLMNPYTIPANVFTFNETYYWQELFSVRNQL